MQNSCHFKGIKDHLFWGWGDGSVGKAIPPKPKDTGSNPETPYKPGIVAHVCNSRDGEMGGRPDFPEANGLTSWHP